ncbi:hypothetical protein C0991_011954 [Blastosporella zonata]|nr:hypothetical protein C0991_011954 [Blastosporella zonata]
MAAPRTRHVGVVAPARSFTPTILDGPLSSTWGSSRDRGRSRSGSWGGRNFSTSATSSSTTDHGWGHRLAEKSRWSSSNADDRPVPLRSTSAYAGNGWDASITKPHDGNRYAEPNSWSFSNGWDSDTDQGKGGKGKSSTNKDATSGWASPATDSYQGREASGMASGRGWDTDTNKGGKGWDSAPSVWGQGSGSTRAADLGWETTPGHTSTVGSRWGPPSNEPSGGGEASKHDANKEAGRRESAWNAGTSDWDTRPKPPAMRPQPATDINKPSSHSSTSRPMTPPLPKRFPLPGRKASSSSSVAQPIAENRTSVSESSLKIKTKGIEPSESLQSAVPTSARPRETPWTRTKIRKSTIQYTMQAVRLQVELEDALAAIERWKRLRASENFSRATPKAREVLEQRRSEYGETAKELEKQLHTTIKYLSEIPEVSTRANLAAAQASEQELLQYTVQLRDWLASLEALYHATLPLEPEPPTLATEVESPKHPKELIWDRIGSYVKLVNDHIDDIYEHLDHRVERERPQDIGSKLNTMLGAHDTKLLAEAEAKFQGMLLESNQIEADFGGLVEETADLITSIHGHDQVLETLKAELQACKEANHQLAGYLAQLEKWKAEDAISISQLTQEVKALHTITRPVPPPLTSDELMPRAEVFALDYMRTEIDSLAAGIQRASSDNRRAFIEKIYKHLEPITKLTNDICRRADAITSRQLVAT